MNQTAVQMMVLQRMEMMDRKVMKLAMIQMMKIVVPKEVALVQMMKIVVPKEVALVV